jgi:hypothetical protein
MLKEGEYAHPYSEFGAPNIVFEVGNDWNV